MSVICAVCNTQFKLSRKNKKYCSSECREIGETPEDNPKRKRTAPEHITPEVLRILENIRSRLSSSHTLQEDALCEFKNWKEALSQIHYFVGVALQYTNKENRWEMRVVGKWTVARWLQWFEEGKHDEIYVLAWIEISPLAPTLFNDQVLDEFTYGGKYCLSQYFAQKRRESVFELLLVPPWARGVMTIPLLGNDLSIYFAANGTFQTYYKLRESIPPDEMVRIANIRDYFDYKLDEMRHCTELISYQRTELLAGKAHIIPPSQMSCVQFLGAETYVPCMLVRAHGDYIGVSSADFNQNLPFLMQSLCGQVVSEKEIALQNLICRRSSLRDNTSREIALRALKLLCTLVRDNPAKYTTFESWTSVYYGLRAAEGRLDPMNFPLNKWLAGRKAPQAIMDDYTRILVNKFKEAHFFSAYFGEVIGARDLSLQLKNCELPDLTPYKQLFVPVYCRLLGHWCLVAVQKRITDYELLTFGECLEVTDCASSIAQLLNSNASTHRRTVITRPLKRCHHNIPNSRWKYSHIYILHLIDMLLAEEMPRIDDSFDPKVKKRKVLQVIEDYGLSIEHRESLNSVALDKSNVISIGNSTPQCDFQASATTIDHAISSLTIDESFFIMPAQYARMLVAFEADLMHKLSIVFNKSFVLLPLYLDDRWELIIVIEPRHILEDKATEVFSTTELGYSVSLVARLLTLCRTNNEHPLCSDIKAHSIGDRERSSDSVAHVIHNIKQFLDRPFKNSAEYSQVSKAKKRKAEYSDGAQPKRTRSGRTALEPADDSGTDDEKKICSNQDRINDL